MFNNHSTDSLSIQTPFDYCICLGKCELRRECLGTGCIHLNRSGKHLQRGFLVLTLTLGNSTLCFKKLLKYNIVCKSISTTVKGILSAKINTILRILLEVQNNDFVSQNTSAYFREYLFSFFNHRSRKQLLSDSFALLATNVFENQ